MRLNKITKFLLAILVAVWIMILFGIAFAIRADDRNNCQNQVPNCDIRTEYGTIRYICSDDQFSYYKVVLNDAYTNVLVTDSTWSSYVFDTTDSAVRQFRFSADSIWAQLWVGENFVGLSDNQNNACSDTPDSQEPAITVNECVGFVIEGLTEFEIDGIMYHTSDGFVSFQVPDDALWTWVMTSDGVYVMTFVQEEIGDCYVTDIDYHWNNEE